MREKESQNPKAWPDWSLLLLALGFALGLAMWVERRVFSDPAALNDDVRNQIYWMAQLANPSAFSQDYIARYFTQPMLISPVLWLLYLLGGQWLSPAQLSQLLPFGMVVLTTFLLFQYAKRYQNGLYAFWVCFSFNCALWIFKNMAGGLSRSFIYPLLFWTLWQLHLKNWAWLGLGLVLSAMIYPPAFFLGFILLVIETLYLANRDGLRKQRLMCLLGSFAGSLGLLFWRSAHSAETQPLFGPLNSNQSIEGLPDFASGGRVVLFPWGSFSEDWIGPLQWVGQILERVPHLYILIPTAGFGLALWLYKRFAQKHWGPLLIPPQVWRLLISSSILYSIAWVFLFYFYVPERYFQYTLPLIPTFMVGAIIYQLQQRYSPAKRWAYLGLAGLGLLITSFFWRADLMNPKASERDLYSFLGKTPAHSMIAASPGLASNIPLYAYRSVYISNEAYIPFHQGYYKVIKDRLKSFLQAYYAVDAQSLSDFVRQNRLDYFVVQAIDFKEPRLSELPKRYYYAFSPDFFLSLKQSNPQNYLLIQAPKRCIPFQTRGLKVIEMPCLIQALQTSASQTR
jgi:hypothetical protein